MKTMTRLAFLLPFALLAACSDDSSGGASTRSTAELQAAWGEHCDDFATCETGRDAPSCKAEFACMQASMRGDMLDKAIACEEARSCETSDDPCYDLQGQGLTPSAAAAKFTSDCVARRTACDGSFNDDYCPGVQMMKDSMVALFADCLADTCDQIKSCFDTAYAAGAPACAGDE